jgi:hypothetical protein
MLSDRAIFDGAELPLSEVGVLMNFSEFQIATIAPRLIREEKARGSVVFHEANPYAALSASVAIGRPCAPNRNFAYAEVGCDLLVYPRDQDRSTIAYTVELVEVSYRVRAP